MAKQQAREQRKKRTKRPTKSSMTFDDLLGVLKETHAIGNGENVAASRDRVCILCLYIFGIRVAELKEITVQNLFDWLDRQSFEISVGKAKTRVKQQIVSSEEGHKMFQKYVKTDLDGVASVYGQGAYLVNLSRDHLTRRINNYFSAYGRKVNKTLLSHSCRISFVTRIIEKFGILRGSSNGGSREYIHNSRI